MTVIPPTTDPPAVAAEFHQKSLDLMVQVRELGQTVDGFNFAPVGRRAAIGAFASLPEEFLELVAADLDVNPSLGESCGITAAEVREALSFKRAFTNAANEIRLVAKGLDDTIAERMAYVGERCLHFYYSAKRATPRGATASAVPHLAEMKRALGKGRPRKKKPEPTPDAAKKGEAK